MSKNRHPKHRQRPRSPQSPFSSYSQRLVTASEINIRKEVQNICRCASEGAINVVGLCKLVFFSTATGDAWMLDWEDQLANCLMKGGEVQPCDFGETDKTFGIRWQGRYQILGDSFVHTSNANPGRVSVVKGYPPQAIVGTIEKLRAAN